MSSSKKEKASGMRQYIVRRLLLMIPTLLGITLFTFMLCQFIPGGPIDQIRLQMTGMDGAAVESGGGGGSQAQLNISEDQLKILEEYYGFDLPIWQRYFRWLGQILRLDLGDSFRYSIPVEEIIARRLPISIYYGIITALFTYAICLPLGIVKAIKHRTLIDNATSIVIFVGYAVPGFVLGGVMLALFSVKWELFPLGGFYGEGFENLSPIEKAKDIIWHSVLPLLSYLVGSFAIMTMLMKNSLMEQMGADYVRTALSKGVGWRRAIFKHAFRNALIPIATSFGNLIGIILTGSVLIEKVFNIQGVGLLMFQAIVARDYPVVLGIILIASILMVIGNLLSDMCVALVDPRVRFN